MNIFHKVALQGLKKSRSRTLVTIIGVVLSAGLITGVVTFGLSLLDYAAKGAAQKYGDWHVAFLDVDASFAQERALEDDVIATATTENIGYAMLDGGTNPDKPYLYITSFGQETFDSLPLMLLSGRMPQNSSEILVSTHVASNGGVEIPVGESLSLSVGTRTNGDTILGQHDAYLPGEVLSAEEEKTYTVVGMYARPEFEETIAPGYTMITKSDASTKANSMSLFVTLQNPREIQSYIADTAAGHAYILNNKVLQFMGLADNASDNLFNAILYAIAGIVVAIIMVGSVFLIYNAFSISINERTQQIGILASVGATAKQVRNMVLFEGLCIGAIGIPIGVLAGLGGIQIVISTVGKSFNSIMYSGVPLTLHLSFFAIAGAAVISLVTILISAYIPAKKAANTPVMECIRQTGEVKVEAKAVKTSKIAHRLYGLEGTLALKNFKRNKKRYRSIVLSLILSVVLFISTSAFVSDLKQVMAQAMMFTTYDIAFGTETMDDGEMIALFDKLKTAEGVTESTYQTVMEYYCAVPTNELVDGYWKTTGESPAEETAVLPIELQILDDDTYLKLIEDAGLPAEEYTEENAKIVATAVMMPGSDEEKGEKEVKDFRDLFSSPTLEASIIPKADGELVWQREQNANITFIKIVTPDIPPTKVDTEYSEQDVYFFQVIVPWSLKDRFIPGDMQTDCRVKGLTFSSETPSQSTAEMNKMIRNSEISVPYMMVDITEMAAENQSYIFIANVFAYTFIIMISLIAVANVFNTISTNIRLRRRELAMLRSVGMSDKAFDKMMRFECAFYGIKALLFGLPIAVLFSWLIYASLGSSEIVFVLPWASIGISVIGVLLVIFITMMYAVGQIRKENIIDALRDDMT